MPHDLNALSGKTIGKERRELQQDIYKHAAKKGVFKYGKNLFFGRNNPAETWLLNEKNGADFFF